MNWSTKWRRGTMPWRRLSNGLDQMGHGAGHLVTIGSAEENDFHFLSPFGNFWMWFSDDASLQELHGSP